MNELVKEGWKSIRLSAVCWWDEILSQLDMAQPRFSTKGSIWTEISHYKLFLFANNYDVMLQTVGNKQW
jgi:hypothetical protein